MQGSSRISQGTARERLETLLASGAADGATIGSALFAVVDALDSTPSLRRALSDPSQDGDAKAALVGRLLDGKVDPAVVDLVASLVRSRWTGARDLGQTAEELAVSAVVAGAESAGRADRVEDELFRFERTVDGDPQLASALADRTASAQRKRQLVADLLHDKVAPETEVLVDRVVLHPRGQHLARALVELGRLASERRQQLVANVIAALPLDVDQHDRLAAALQRMYGKTVHLNVDVVPDVLGGIRVEVGDEVLDGTVSRRLDDVRRSLGG